MWKTSVVLFLVFCLSLSSKGQTGSEWIDFTKAYYKFKIAEDDFYRIDRTQLEAAGFPVSTTAASKVQLFREGQEVALNVDATAENTINFIEFYGKKRDGSQDSPLYLPGTQPHSLYSLFSDSAAYFLTIALGSENGKRMGFSSDRNTVGLTPEAYHVEDSLILFTNSYASGRQVNFTNGITLSDYDDGEGWCGPALSKSQVRDFSFNLPELTSGFTTSLESVFFGRNSLNHNVNLLAGPDASSTSMIGNVQFAGYSSTSSSVSVANDLLGDDQVTVRVAVEGFPNQGDRISIGYLRLLFPQSFELTIPRNKVFNLDNLTERRAWLQIGTSQASSLRAFDITDPFNAIRLASTSFSDRLEVVVSDVSLGNKILTVSTPASVGQITLANIPNYNLSDKDYHIITHASLQEDGDPVATYESYRSSDAGGGYNVHTVIINDLYDLFSFGDPTPLAIRRFIEVAESNHPISHVFIVGKGFTPNQNSFRNEAAINIPTYGLPGGDLMYTLGINTEARTPGISIGRLNATTPQQVTDYLNKVIEMEALPFDNLFRKDFLQLSGGLTQQEISSFSRIVGDLAAIAENDFIGGRAFNTGKQSNESVEFINISDRVNQGVGYITFFGHSSGTVSDIEVGLASEPSFGFTNQGKYPIFLVNGCDAGEIFNNNFTYGEDWIFTPDRGAINFIAHTSAALSNTLRKWSDFYYNIGYADDQFIGKSVGDIIIETGKRYRASDQDEIDLTQIRQMQLQGDPAYRIFGADFPDFQIENGSLSAVSISGREILAEQDSFKLEIIVRNFGRTTQDSLSVQVDRTFPDGAQATYIRNFPSVLRLDTIEFFLPLPDENINVGTSLLRIALDPQNEQEELQEGNNQALLEVDIFNGNTFNLFPQEHAVLDENQILFVWQSSSLLEDSRSYDLELDTSPTYASANRRSFTVVGEVLLRQLFDFSQFSLVDSTTVYWRTRFTDPAPDESNNWVESSFTLISNSTEGWGQYTADQLNNGRVSGIGFNTSTQQWEFQSSSTPIDFLTVGADNTEFDTDDLRAIVDGVNLFVSAATGRVDCINNTLNAIAFDKESGDPYYPILVSNTQDVLTTALCGRRPQRIYQFTGPALDDNEPRASIANFTLPDLIDAMRQGDQLIMFNIGLVNYSEWEPEVIAAMNEMGISSTTLTSLTDGQPV
ncbi:MAG: C25 family cysteine peptidase, partial [Bacteroidota bacterium]